MCSRFQPGDRVELKGTGTTGEVRYVDCRAYRCSVTFKPDALAGTKYLVAVDQVVLEPAGK